MILGSNQVHEARGQLEADPVERVGRDRRSLFRPKVDRRAQSAPCQAESRCGDGAG